VKCPECGSENHRKAVRCNCGYWLRDLRSKKSFLRMWPGYLLAILIIFASYDQIETNNYRLTPLLLMFDAAGWIYWFVFIYKLHSALQVATGGNHPIKPGKSVWGHLIPLYNFYWVFEWSNEVANFLNNRTKSRIKKNWIGLLLVVCLILGSIMAVVDHPKDYAQASIIIGIALIIQFSLGHLLNKKLGKLILE